MREILFRGQDYDGKWFEGGIIPLDLDSGYVFIVEPYFSASTLPVYEVIRQQAHFVNPETVGQYTGLTDKNGYKKGVDDLAYRLKNIPRSVVYKWEIDQIVEELEGD